MSTIITTDPSTMKPKIIIDAGYSRTIIRDTNITGQIIEIIGSTAKPFIFSVYFEGCTIIAENMNAFGECCFDNDCKMIIGEMTRENSNRVDVEQ